MPKAGGNPLIGRLDRTPAQGVNIKLPDAFYNDIDPAKGQMHKRERPAHRLMIMMAANGATIKEIAEKLELSATNVSNVLRQPWAREKLQNFMKENAEESLQDILKGAAAPALKRIIAIAETSEDEAVKLRANQDITDRFLGKASQKVITEDVTPEKLSDEELERLIQQKRSN